MKEEWSFHIWNSQRYSELWEWESLHMNMVFLGLYVPYILLSL